MSGVMSSKKVRVAVMNGVRSRVKDHSFNQSIRNFFSSLVFNNETKGYKLISGSFRTLSFQWLGRSSVLTLFGLSTKPTVCNSFSIIGIATTNTPN